MGFLEDLWDEAVNQPDRAKDKPLHPLYPVVVVVDIVDDPIKDLIVDPVKDKLDDLNPLPEIEEAAREAAEVLAMFIKVALVALFILALRYTK